MSLFDPQVGVYRIAHQPSGRYYVGSSKRLAIRLMQHRTALARGGHHCRRLQAIWRKYPAEQFEFEVIANCQTWSDALDLEQRFLDETAADPLRVNGSNKARMPILCPEVMARARATANASEVYIEVHRKVCQERNSDPSFQARATAAVRASARHKEAVRRNALRLQDPEIVAKNRAAIRSNGKQSEAARRQAQILNANPESRRKTLEKTSLAVVGVHVKTGEVVRFPSQSAAARAVGAVSSNISMCCSGKTQTCKGYRWTNAPATASQEPDKSNTMVPDHMAIAPQGRPP